MYPVHHSVLICPVNKTIQETVDRPTRVLHKLLKDLTWTCFRSYHLPLESLFIFALCVRYKQAMFQRHGQSGCTNLSSESSVPLQQTDNYKIFDYAGRKIGLDSRAAYTMGNTNNRAVFRSKWTYSYARIPIPRWSREIR